MPSACLQKAPGMDRSTKEEAVDVDELAGRLVSPLSPCGAHSLPSLRLV